MFYVENDEIVLHRRNTGNIYIKKKEYIFQIGDIVTLTVKKDIGSEQVLIRKIEKVEQSKEKIMFRFTSAGTDLQPGKYVYDIRIDYANGDISTVKYPKKPPLPPYNFFVREVVNDE